MHTANRTNGRGPGPEYVYAKCEQAIIVETEVKIVFNYGYRVQKAASELGRLWVFEYQNVIFATFRFS